MKKSTKIPPKINNIPDNTIVVLMTAIIIFSIVVAGYAIFITSLYTTETQIIKVKYASVSSLGIMTDCGHPIHYHRSLVNDKINLSDVYEVTINKSMFGEEITSFKLLDKEKYIENC